ncbi:MAG: ABC-2 family transporter protein, partial [Oligoflexia bacterium]|nr:ABC-2 family transporter protein [Oligoflexia bacterium]
YWAIYKEFFKTSLSEDLSFRANFTLQSLMNTSFIGVYFFTSVFIFNHVEQIGLWNREQFLFFLSFALFIDQIHYLVFSFNFWIFSDEVRLGSFDFTLLKPYPSLFITFFKRLAIPGVFTTIIAFFMLVYFGLKVDLNIWMWLSLPFCLILSLALLLSIEVLISVFNFFTIEGIGINQARLQVQQLCRWPDFIYKNPARLWLIPFLAITSIPVRYLLDFNYWTWLIILLGGVCLFWFVIIFFLWPKALSFYESASS